MKILLSILLLLLVITCAFINGDKKPERAKSPAERYDSKFDPWYDCRWAVKQVLKDPDSYKAISEKGFGNYERSRGVLEFTATNSFGGRIRSSAECEFERGRMVIFTYDGKRYDLR